MADGLKIKFTLDGSQPTKEIARLGRLIEGIRAEARDVKISLDVEASGFEKVTKEVKEWGAVEVPTDAFDDVGDSAVRSASDIADLAVEAERVVEALETPTSMEVDVEQAKGKLESIKRVARAAVTSESLESVGSFLSDFGAEGEEAIDAMRRLQARTGATGEELKRLEQIGRDTFADGVGDSVTEVIDTVAVARQQLGTFVDDADLSSVVTQASAIAKVFDEDVNGVLASARPFMSQFKLEGEEAFDLIALGMQKAGSRSADFLDTIDEYSDKIAGAGIDAEQFVGTLINGMEAGFRNTDQLADALKEAGIQIREGATTEALSKIEGDTAKNIAGVVEAARKGKIEIADALKLSSKEIERAFDAGEITAATREQLQKALSGTLGEEIGGDLFAKIFSADIDTDAITEQARLAGEQMNAAIEPKTAFEKFQRGFLALRQQAAETFGPIASEAGQALTAISQIGPGVLVVSDRMKELGGVSGLLSSMKGSLGGVTAGVKSLGGSIGSVLTGPVGIFAALAGVLVLAYQNSEQFREAVDNLLVVLGDALAPVAEELGGLFAQIVEAISPLLGELGTLAGELLTALMPALEVVFGLVGELAGVLGNILTPVISFLTPVISTLADVLGAVLGVVGDLVGFLVDGLFTVLADIGAFLENVFIAAWNAVIDVFDALWGGVKSVVGVYVDFYSAIWDVASAVGSFMADITGLTDAFGFLADPIGGVVDEIGGFIGGLFSSGDESKKTEKKVRELAAAEQDLAKSSEQAGFSLIRMGQDAVKAANLAKQAQAVVNTVTSSWMGDTGTAEQSGFEVGTAWTGGTSSGVTSGTQRAKEAAADFTNVMEKAARERVAILRDLQIAAIEDERERIIAQQAWKREQEEQAIRDEIAAIDKKIAELQEKEEDGYEVTIIKEQEARKALADLLLAVEEKSGTERLEALQAFHAKELDEIDKQTAAVLAAREERLSLVRDLADIETLEGLEASIRAETRLVDIALEEQLRAFAESDERFIEAREETTRQLAEGTIDRTEAERRLEQKRKEIVFEAMRDSESTLSLLVEQSNRKRDAIILDGARRRRQLEEEELQRTNELYRATVLVRENLFNAFIADTDDVENEQHKEELDRIAEQRDAYLDMFNEAKIGRGELYDKMNELSARERELIEESAGARFDAVEGLRKGVEETLRLYSEDFARDVATSTEKVRAILLEQSEEMEALGVKAGDLNGLLLDTAEDAAYQIGALTAAQVAAGENLFKSFASNTLDIALQLLVAESKAVVALIFGKSVAANPLAGAALAAGLIGTFSLLVNLAKSAMSSASFFHGGTFRPDMSSGGRTPGGPLDGYPVTLHGGEEIIPWHVAKDHRKTFRDIRAGVDPLTAAIRHSAGAWKTWMGGADVNRPEVRRFLAEVVSRFGADRRGIEAMTRELASLREENRGLRDTLDRLSEQMENVAARFESRTAHEHHFGELRADGRDLVAVVEKSQSGDLAT